MLIFTWLINRFGKNFPKILDSISMASSLQQVWYTTKH